MQQTIIFGAGASVPFFAPCLSTKYLTNKVKDRNEWNRVMSKYRLFDKDAMLASVNQVMAVIDRILLYQPEAHFEQIAEVIDKISSYGYDGIPCNNMMNLQLRVMLDLGFSNSGPTAMIGPEWKDIPFLFREIIAEAILDLENNHKVPQYEELLGFQRDFIRMVSSQSNVVSVLSFNYDDCVLDSLEGLGFEKGFDLKDSYYLRQLNPRTLLKAKQAAYFPHGHLKFQFTDNDNVTFWGDSNVANEQRWNGINGVRMGSTLSVLNGKYAYNFNTFITTGQTKDDSLNHMPYSVYYQRLASDLEKSNVVYLIGYSFGDDHINRLLQSYLKIDPANKVFVVDYYEAPISLTDEYTSDSNILNRIHLVLGTTWQLRVSPDGQKQPFHPENVEALKTKGYGEVFDQVVFYKKGYDSFLHEFRDVI